ncbi:MAG: NAD-dependent dehydratase [Candidatus Cloacimonas sp. 4484_209]|nr:MAG: NAD-dependent dehydratase [Candidatus Cloacimonas sp. 4484_209]
MRIVLTGGAGFIGSHLTEYLLSKNHFVIVLDNFITGKEENIAPFFGNKNFLFKKQDVTEFIDIDGDVDYVLHFASPASPIDYLKYPIQTLKAGGLGTLNCLGLSKRKKARFLLASTSEVYGDPQVHPQTEDYWGHVNPIGPRGVYDEAKRYAEALTMAYHRFHKLDTRIVRIFNTYGPKMRPDDGRVIPTFFMQCLNDKPITIFGSGKQTRSFCYISDLVEGIYKLMFIDYYDPINLGNPNEISINDLAKTLCEVSGRKISIAYKTLPEDDPKYRKPDITKAHSILGWEPKVKLKEGLSNTFKWFEKFIQNDEDE